MKACRCKPYGKWRGACRVKREKFKRGEVVLLTYPPYLGGGTSIRTVVKEWINKATGRRWIDTRRIDRNIGGHCDPAWLSKIPRIAIRTKP